MNANIVDKSQQTIDEEKFNVYTVSLSSSNFKEFANANDQMSIEIYTTESKDEEKEANSMWLYIAIGGGAFLLVVIVLVIIIKKRRSGGGGKKSQKTETFDYRKMYN